MTINFTHLFAFFGVASISGLYWYVVGVRRGIVKGGLALAHIIQHMPPDEQAKFEAAAKAAILKTTSRVQGNSR